MLRFTSVMAIHMMMTVALLSCDLSPDTPTSARPDASESPQVLSEPPATVTPPEPVPTMTPTLLPLRVATTTTDPLYTSAEDLDHSPDGSAGDRAKIVAHSTLIIIGTVSDIDPHV